MEKSLDRIKNPKEKIKLAVVGKYVELKDAYISVNEAIENAAYEQGIKLKSTIFKQRILI